MQGLIDTHAHLDEIPDLSGVVQAAKRAGVTAVIAVGSDISSNQKGLALAREYPGYVCPALGLHPWNLKEAEIQGTLEFIDKHAGEGVGIGEIGLDYHKRVIAVAGKDRQKQVFSDLLGIAKKHDKPALIHSRYAWRDSLEEVIRAGVARAVFHWFTGPSSVLRDLIAQGYYLSATPAAEYHEEHRRAVREAPLDLLLLETDSPVTYGRGSGSEFEASPADVRRSASASAILKGLSEEAIARATTSNAVKLFGLSV
jgi:TatD DNase family protein